MFSQSGDTEMSSDKGQYLEFIVRTVERLASNSFGYKTLAVTLTAALLAWFSGHRDYSWKAYEDFIIFVPIVGLWYLDSMCLSRERAYRELYDVARKEEMASFDMNVLHGVKRYRRHAAAFFSAEILTFYLGLMALAVLGLGIRPASSGW